jgi:hypothetical protein
LLAGILVTAVLSRTGSADSVHPVKPLTAGLAFMGYAGATNGVAENGLGPTAELALGCGRTQYFLETGVAWMKLGVVEPQPGAFVWRGALGARWIARSFDFDRGGAVEMTLDALAGANKIWWDEGGDAVRPEFAAGVGFQMRKFHSPHFMARFGIRFYFAPTDDAVMPALRCTGKCPTPTPLTDGGVMFSFGGAM